MPDSFQKLLGRMTSSRAAAVACGSASLGPRLRERLAPLGPAGRVGWGGVGWGASWDELHVPGELCGQARAGQPPHSRVSREPAVPPPPMRDTREPAAQHT